jgi:hypothetical protein
MLIVSAGFKTGILGSSSFAGLFNGGRIRIFSGARPVFSEMPEPSANWMGDVVWSGFDVGLQFVQAGPSVTKRLLDVWQLLPTAAGTATWWRLIGPDDDGSTSFSAPRIDGDIGTPAQPQELVMTSTTLSPGTALSISDFVFTIPPLVGL